MDVTVRRAQEGDAEFLVWVMMAAARSHLDRCVWSTLFGTDDTATAELLGEVLHRGPVHWCHLDRFFVAEVDGSPAAAATSFDPDQHGTDVLSEAVLDAVSDQGISGDRLDEMLSRSVLLDAVTPKDHADSWAIENVAVRPEHRSQGLVERLFEVALDEGRAAGRDHAQIMCLNGNDRAQRAWERNGFEVRADYRSRPFAATFGCDGMKLLVRSL